MLISCVSVASSGAGAVLLEEVEVEVEAEVDRHLVPSPIREKVAFTFTALQLLVPSGPAAVTRARACTARSGGCGRDRARQPRRSITSLF